MTIALVQSVSVTGAIPVITIAPTAAGNLLVVLVNDTLNTVTGIADDAGNTYQAVSGARATNTAVTTSTDIWYAANIAAGATTVTITFSGSHNGLYQVVEYSGAKTTSPVDAGAHISDANATVVGPDLVVTDGNDLLVAVVAVGVSNPASVGAPWSTIPSSPNHVFAQSIAPGSTGTYAAPYSAGSQQFCSSGAAFFVSGSGAPSVGNTSFLVF